MQLTSISLFGFKSFAERSTLKFESGVTAVVGPNGSGKSNIADAVRWVLGEQSNRLLRAKRGEDVVFFGSDKKNKSSFAEVSLTLDNSDGTVPIEYIEVKITRRLYRSGESEYLVNGKKVRLLDVVELLAKAGFGAATYTVIGQGMIDAVLISTPAERKEFFDEASGIKQYEIKREQSVRKLEQTDQNLLRSKDIVAELTPRLAALRRQSKRAERKDTLTAELATTADKYFRALYAKLTGRMNETKSKREQFEKESDKLSAEIAGLNQDMAASELIDREQEIATKELKEKLEALSATRDEFKEKLIVASGRLEVVREREGGYIREALKHELVRSAKRGEDIQAELTGEREELVKLEAQAATQSKLRAGLAAKINEIEQAIKEFGEPYTLSKAGAEMSVVSGQQEAFMASLKAVGSMTEVAELIKEADRIGRTLADLMKKCSDQTHERFEKLNIELSGLTGQLTGEAEMAKYASARIESVKRVIANLERELADALAAAKSADEKLKLEADGSHKAEIKRLESETAKLTGELAAKEEAREEAVRSLEAKEQEFKGRRDQFGEIERGRQEKAQLLDQHKTRLNEYDIELAKIETRLEAWREEAESELGGQARAAIAGSPLLTERLNTDELRQQMETLKRQIGEIGSIDAETLAEYHEVESRHNFLTTEIADLEAAAADLQKVIVELDALIHERFRESFARINEEFGKYFKILFGGGSAALRLVNEDEGGRGVEITANPPGKRVHSLSTLSGGERTMTAIALLAAILAVNRSPFVVFDEVDAALDEPNTVRFLKIITELAARTQFIVITHNKETMKAADIIYGVTMDDHNASKLLSIRLEQAEEVAR